MKRIIILLFAFGISITSKAQLHNLNDAELFDGIKFNNISLGEIMRARGDLSKMKIMFGDNIKEVANDTAPFLAKELYNDDIDFSFEDETDTGNNYDLAFIYVLSSNVVVQVKDLTIRIGDPKSKFSNYTYNPTAKSFVFTDEDTGSVSLAFKIDEATNQVSEIKFIAF